MDDVLAKARREDGSSAVSALLPPESVPGERERETEKPDGRTDGQRNECKCMGGQTDRHTHTYAHTCEMKILLCAFVLPLLLLFLRVERVFVLPDFRERSVEQASK